MVKYWGGGSELMWLQSKGSKEENLRRAWEFEQRHALRLLRPALERGVKRPRRYHESSLQVFIVCI
jgi:hypothetical protein